jgi:hypothetical protein
LKLQAQVTVLRIRIGRNKERARTVEEAFVAVYRAVLWVAMGLALANSLCVVAFIQTDRQSERSRRRWGG